MFRFSPLPVRAPRRAGSRPRITARADAGRPNPAGRPRWVVHRVPRRSPSFFSTTSEVGTGPPRESPGRGCARASIAPTFSPATGRPLLVAMTSPPWVSVSTALCRRSTLDGAHQTRRYTPPSPALQPSPTSRPGPTQGTPGHWWCRPPTKRGHLRRRRAQDGVDLDEQLDFLGQR